MERINEHIFRLWIPFEAVLTSVFIVKTDEGTVILDTATTRDDVESYILPALRSLALTPDLIIASHSHRDHMGGLPFLAERFPRAKVAAFDNSHSEAFPKAQRIPLYDGCLLLGCLRILHIPGHSPDALAVLDERTKTLLTFDGTQGFGVGRFGSGIGDVAQYLKSITRMETLGAERIEAAHDFIPQGHGAVGVDGVRQYLHICRDTALALVTYVEKHSALSPEEISSLYIATYPDRPPLSPGGVRTMKRYIEVAKNGNL